MRCLALVSLTLVGCGRLGFDSSAAGPSDSGVDSSVDAPIGTVAIHAPAEGSNVGSSAHIVGTCTAGIAIELGGTGLAAPGHGTCTAGAFAVDVAFTAGGGAKQVAIAQGGAPAIVTLTRVDAPIEFHSARKAQTEGAGPATDCDLVIPAPDMAEHDVLVGMIYTDNGPTGSVTVPAGFTRLAADTAHGVGFFHFVADLTSEPASYTFHVVAGTGQTDTCAAGGAMVAFVNVDPTDPIVAQSQQTAITSVVSAPSVTALQSSLLVGLFGANGPANDLPIPSGMTSEGTANGVSLSGFAATRVAWQTITQTGVSGERTSSLPAAIEWLAGLVDLRPR